MQKKEKATGQAAVIEEAGFSMYHLYMMTIIGLLIGAYAQKYLL